MCVRVGMCVNLTACVCGLYSTCVGVCACVRCVGKKEMTGRNLYKYLL